MIDEETMLTMLLYRLHELDRELHNRCEIFWKVLRNGRTPEETLAKLEELRRVFDIQFNENQVSDYPGDISVRVTFLFDEIRQKKLDTATSK